MAERNPVVAGFNHNVRHNGKLYHVQTEDSGIGTPRIATHVFLGGSIISSRTGSYAELLDSEDLPALVRARMEEQHKLVLRELVRGAYDAADAAYGERARALQREIAGPGVAPAALAPQPAAPQPLVTPPRAPEDRTAPAAVRWPPGAPALTPPPMLRRERLAPPPLPPRPAPASPVDVDRAAPTPDELILAYLAGVSGGRK